MAEAMSAAQFGAEFDLPDWRILDRRIETVIRAGSFAGAAGFVGEVAAAADELDHHPDVTMRYPDRVGVAMWSHDAGGLTARDARLAQRISAMAAGHRYSAEPMTPQGMEIGIDVVDVAAVAAFWAAVLAYETRPGDGKYVNLVDPRGSGPNVWFQPMKELRRERNHIHIDVLVPADLAEERIAAAVAAGGVLISDEFAPSWWVMADVEGNEACVCTCLNRT